MTRPARFLGSLDGPGSLRTRSWGIDDAIDEPGWTVTRGAANLITNSTAF